MNPGTMWTPQELPADDPLAGEPGSDEVAELLRALRAKSDPFRYDPDKTTREEI